MIHILHTFILLSIFLVTLNGMQLWGEVPVTPSGGVYVEKYASELELIFLGSIVGRQKDNVVLLKHTDTSKVNAYKVGFTLKEEYVIHSISANFLILFSTENMGNKPIKVLKDGFLSKTKVKKDVEQPKIKIQKYDGEYNEEGFSRRENEIEMAEDFREKMIREDLPKILMQASAEPIIADGQIIGFILDQIEEKSIYQKAGLRDGDIITAINGIKLDDVTATIKLLHSLKTSKNIEFVLKRDHQNHTVNVNIK